MRLSTAMNEFTKQEINEYLFLEFGISDEGGDESQVGDDWPFVLEHVGAIGLLGRTTEVYRFSENGEEFFALAGPSLTFVSVAGMNLADLDQVERGLQWIGDQEPVDLETARLGDSRVPSGLDRQSAATKLATTVHAESSVLGGPYLVRRREQVVLASDPRRSDEAVLVGEHLPPMTVGFSRASSYRRLGWAIGKLLSEGKL